MSTEILDQIKTYSEAKRIQQVKACFDKVIQLNDLVVRSVNASLGNNLEVEKDKLRSSYLSTMKDNVLTWRNKYTGMHLVHYACEYPCLRLIKSLVKVKGVAFVMDQMC